ncbi:HNH endonuclease [Paenibacillus sp. NPDC055715]
MSISSKTRKMLWGRAANRCALCRMELVMDETETDDESVIGDECHIVARETDGARGESILNSDERDRYRNLILLCKIHHKVIDDQPGGYTVEHLNKIKETHEQWVKDSLSIDNQKQRDEEIYMTFIDKWSDLCDLNNWEAWTSWLIGAGGSSISIEMEAKLQGVKTYLFSRIWPTVYPDLKESFENFLEILNDFLSVFHKYSEERNDHYYTERFYSTKEHTEEKYNDLLNKYKFHVSLVQDLIVELTRAGNYICDMIRRFLTPSYRMEAGFLIVQSGPHIDMNFRMHRPQYREEEKTKKPYPGLNEFKKIRDTRDISFGPGINTEKTHHF